MNAEVVAVSMDDLSGAVSLVRQFGLQFPVLYTSGDPAVPQAYGVYALHEPRLAAPSVFLVDREGRLAWRQLSSRYTDRAATGQIIEQLKKLT